MYVYIKSEPNLYTVGFYAPNGLWQSESDHDNKDKAAERAAWLNGERTGQNDFKPDWSKSEAALREAIEAMGNIQKQRDDLLAACEGLIKAWSGITRPRSMHQLSQDMDLACKNAKQVIAQAKKG